MLDTYSGMQQLGGFRFSCFNHLYLLRGYKMKLSLKKSTLEAALLCAAVNDIRYYLKGAAD